MNKFLKSALTEKNVSISTHDVEAWLESRRQEVLVDVKMINFSELDQWSFDLNKSMLSHSTGHFFTIEGIEIKTNWGIKRSWCQPIINQAEIGYLGILTKEFDGILHFLLQAKIEPGNINHVQLSPTLQATKSNYTQIHGGNAPAYLEYFRDRKNVHILLDQLQSEQGSRFLQKRNRNLIIEVFDDIEVEANFIWLTLGQIKKLLTKNNLVNMDTRTVISGIPFSIFDEVGLSLFPENERSTRLLISSTSKHASQYTIDEIIAWITDLKCKYELKLRQVPLSSLADWIISEDEIYHYQRKYFRVIAVDISIGNREVRQWSQPMVQPAQEGLIAFVVKEIYGVLHFLVQAKLECGNFDIIELAPTVQTLTGDYRKPEYKIPFIDYVLNAKKEAIWLDTNQSEEGGRFYEEQNRNIIVEADNKLPEKIPENFIWMTLNQLNSFMKYNNYLNIQARSLLASIGFLS